MEDSSLVSHKQNLPREAKKTNDSTFDRIYKYFNSESRVELKPEEQLVAQRWEKAWYLLTRHRTRNQVAIILMKLFNISRATAYDDVRNAMNLFTDPREDMKAAKRTIAEAALLKGADAAWKRGDLDAYHKFWKEYSDINGLKDEVVDNGLADIIKKLKPTQIILQYKKDDVEREAEALRDQLTLDVEHEETESDEAEG